MVKKTIFLIMAFFLMSGLATGQTMLLPTSQQVFSYDPLYNPLISGDPNTARPIGVGSIATGGDTLSIHINIGQFSGPVDIYFGIFAPSIDPDNIYMLTSDYSLQPSSIGLYPWKINTTGPIDEYLFGDILISLLPSTTYILYLAVTPANSVDTFYIWATYFVVQSECPYIAGIWTYSETITRQCNYGGEIDISTLNVTSQLNIGQDACNVGYYALTPYPGLERYGTLTSNTIEVSGPSAIAVHEGVVFDQNTYTASGTISGNEIIMNGSGFVKGKSCEEYNGKQECYDFSCTTIEDIVRFTR